MSARQANNERNRPLTTLIFLSLAVITAAFVPPPTLAQDPTCATAQALPAGSILRRQHEAASSEPDLVRLPIPEPGVVELYISPGARADLPRITFLGTACGSPEGEGVSWIPIRETPRELHLMIRQGGDYFVTVSSEDPAVPVGGYTLHASFAAERPAPDEVIALDTNPPADCQASDLPTFSPEPLDASRHVVVRRDGFTKEVDPWDDDGLSGINATSGVLVVEGAETSLEASLHDSEDCSLEQRLAEGSLGDPGAFVAAPVHAGTKRILLTPSSASDLHYDVDIRHFALCGATQDDHPDRPLCATVLSSGENVTGLVSPAGDEDHFTFTLAAQNTIAIDLLGGDGVRGVLHDHDGQRLDTWSPGRLVRTLGPGRFYLLVTGLDDWNGEYSVQRVTMP